MLAVAHRRLLERPMEKLVSKVRANGLLVDVKSVLSPQELRARGLTVWGL